MGMGSWRWVPEDGIFSFTVFIQFCNFCVDQMILGVYGREHGDGSQATDTNLNFFVDEYMILVA